MSCGQPLTVIKGIEVGHIFKLGYKYTDAIDITVSGPDGKPVRPIMGCYGIGVERAMAACIEVHHDDEGHRLAGQRRPVRGRRRGRAAERRDASPRRGSGPTRPCSTPGWT